MPLIDSFFYDKSVLIHGASSGIGEELAWQLGRAGTRLTLTARRRELLDRLGQKILATGNSAPLAVCHEQVRCPCSRQFQYSRIRPLRRQSYSHQPWLRRQ